MDEVCVNGHTRTKENTRYYKYGRGETRKRVCSDCRKRSNKVTVTAGNPAAHEIAKQRTTERIEDVEDLLRFGATFQEIVARSGYSTWPILRQSLRRRGREDLLEAMLKKHGGKPPKGMTGSTRKRKPYCGLRTCSRKRYAKNRCKPHYMQERAGVKQPQRKFCELPDCGDKHKALGLCEKHYTRKRRGKLDTNTGD